MKPREIQVTYYGGPRDGEVITVPMAPDQVTNRPMVMVPGLHNEGFLELPIEIEKSGRLVIRWPKGYS